MAAAKKDNLRACHGNRNPISAVREGVHPSGLAAAQGAPNVSLLSTVPSRIYLPAHARRPRCVGCEHQAAKNRLDRLKSSPTYGGGMLRRARMFLLLNAVIVGVSVTLLVGPRDAMASVGQTCEHKQCNGTRSCEFGAGYSCTPDPIGGVECLTKYCWDQ